MLICETSDQKAIGSMYECFIEALQKRCVMKAFDPPGVFNDSLTEFTGHQLNRKKHHSKTLLCSGKNEKQTIFNSLKIIFEKLKTIFWIACTWAILLPLEIRQGAIWRHWSGTDHATDERNLDDNFTCGSEAIKNADQFLRQFFLWNWK